MIPPLPRRRLRLQPPILNGKQIRKHTTLVHRDPEEFGPPLAAPRPQLLARRRHRLLLPLQLQLARAPLLRLVQLPGAVDGPVAQGAAAGEFQGARGEGVVEEVAD